MGEKHEQEKRTQSFILVHSLFLEKLIQLSNPQPEFDLHYESRILISNNHFHFVCLTIIFSQFQVN